MDGKGGERGAGENSSETLAWKAIGHLESPEIYLPKILNLPAIKARGGQRSTGCKWLRKWGGGCMMLVL